MDTTRTNADRLTDRLLGLYLVAAFVFILTPIVTTLIFSFNADRFSSLPWRGFTLGWYARLIEYPELWVPLQNSLVVAFAVSLTSAVLGFAAAYALVNSRFRGQDALVLALISPLAVPWILLGLGLLLFLSRLGLGNTLTAVWLSHTVFAAPLATVVIRARLSGMRKSFEEAAWDLGCNRLRAIWEVVLPAALPGVMAAILLTFTLSFDEFILAWFVCGFEETLPVKIWSMMRSGTNPTINAIGAIVFSVSITMTVVAQFLMRRRTA
jgi:spermidine/putrescine transport system permease protein